jgi:FkbM family methyltransferase
MFRTFINRHLVARLEHHFAGRRFSQGLWESLHALSLRGMNIGGSSRAGDNGELWVLSNLLKAVRDAAPPVVFDVGANVGDYALQVLSRQEDARVYCFEPARKSFELLCANLSNLPNVSLHNFGLGDKEESKTMYSDSEASAIASVYHRRLEHINVSMDLKEEVSLKTLDGFCAGEGVGHITLLKIDVEGHELKVLEGARRMIDSRAIDLIQFEFGGTDIDARIFLKDFFDLFHRNYTICRIVKDGVVPLEVYQERFEVFVYSNFLAISKEAYDACVPRR